jgi:hypothetical protein
MIEVVFMEVDNQRFLGHGWLPDAFGVPNNKRVLATSGTKSDLP